jgi:hypothetical protein
LNEALIRREGILMSKTDAKKTVSTKIFRFVPAAREDSKKLDERNKEASPRDDGDNDPGPAAA